MLSLLFTSHMVSFSGICCLWKVTPPSPHRTFNLSPTTWNSRSCLCLFWVYDLACHEVKIFFFFFRSFACEKSLSFFHILIIFYKFTLLSLRTFFGFNYTCISLVFYVDRNLSYGWISRRVDLRMKTRSRFGSSDESKAT